MLKTILTIAGVLVLGQAVRLPAADAQSGYRSPNDPGSPKGVADYRPTLVSFFPNGVMPAPGGEGTAQPRSSNLVVLFVVFPRRDGQPRAPSSRRPTTTHLLPPPVRAKSARGIVIVLLRDGSAAASKVRPCALIITSNLGKRASSA